MFAVLLLALASVLAPHILLLYEGLHGGLCERRRGRGTVLVLRRAVREKKRPRCCPRPQVLLELDEGGRRYAVLTAPVEAGGAPAVLQARAPAAAPPRAHTHSKLDGGLPTGELQCGARCPLFFGELQDRNHRGDSAPSTFHIGQSVCRPAQSTRWQTYLRESIPARQFTMLAAKGPGTKI